MKYEYIAIVNVDNFPEKVKLCTSFDAAKNFMERTKADYVRNGFEVLFETETNFHGKYNNHKVMGTVKQIDSEVLGNGINI